VGKLYHKGETAYPDSLTRARRCFSCVCNDLRIDRYFADLQSTVAGQLISGIIVILKRGSSREESAVFLPAESRFLADEPGFGMTIPVLVFCTNCASSPSTERFVPLRHLFPTFIIPDSAQRALPVRGKGISHLQLYELLDLLSAR
jgi:hypothetical protein